VTSEERKRGFALPVTPFAVTVAVIFFLLLAAPLSPAVADVPENEPPEIRRVLLRPEQLPAELERVRRGVLREMPLAEFDDLVGKAADAAAARRDPPKLLATHWQASLVGESLTGSAECKVLHRRPANGVLALEPFNQALQHATWEDGTPAVVGVLGARQGTSVFGCIVGRPGEQTLALDWSARGRQEPAGLRFDLRVPPSPLAVLDLDLPTDREPGVSRGQVLLTGPTDGAAANRRTWRIAFANTSQIDLVLRDVGGRGRPPLVLAHQRTRQDITPGCTECEFLFDFEAPHGGVRELTLACAPGLRPTEVTARGSDRLEFRSAGAEGGVYHVVVIFAEPLMSGTVTLRAVSAAPLDGRWTSPAAAVVDAVPQGESLVVRVHPDLTADDWLHGPFRLSESTRTTDRWQMMTFRSGLIRTGPGRPECSLKLAAPGYTVDERLWLFASPEHISLTARLAFAVAHGPVYRLPLAIPPGWDVDRVETDPPDMLAPVRPIARDGLLQIELQRPFAPTSPGRLIAHLTRRPPQPEERIPFPDVVPTATTARSGWLALKSGPELESDRPASPRVEFADAGPAPWGDVPPDAVYSLGEKPIAGTLRSSRRPARIGGHVVTTVTVVGPRAAVDYRARLELEEGRPESIVLRVCGTAEPWDWRVVEGTNRVRSVQRLPMPPAELSATLAARSPWQVFAGFAAANQTVTSFWRVTLTRPLTEPVTLETRVDVSKPLTGPWALPLVDVPAVERTDAVVDVDVRSAPAWDARTAGLEKIPAADDSPWRRRFRYGAGPISLWLIPRSDGPTPRIEDALLLTFVTQAGRLVHSLSFRLSDWQRPTIPLDLPEGSSGWQVRIDGAAARAKLAILDGGVHLELPSLTDGRAHAVEITYTTPSSDGLFSPMKALPPRLPADAGDLRRLWCLPSGFAPVGNWREVTRAEAGGAADTSLPAELAHGAFWAPAGEANDGLRLVRCADVQLMGFLFAGAGLAFARAARAWPARRRWSALGLWLAASAGAAISLPSPLQLAADWSLIAAGVVAVWTLLPFARQIPDGRRSAMRAATAVVILTVPALPALFNLRLDAANPGPVLVYLVPKPEDPTDVQAVLAPADVVELLRAEARPTTAGLEGAVWQEASYEGRVVAGQARFTAVLRLQSFAEDPPPTVLPLTAVQIREATLDGAPAYLRSAGEHYLVPVHGRGSHRLEVSFDAAVAAYPPAAGDGRTESPDREVRLGIPEIAISRLSLTGPAGAKNLQCLAGRGGQQVDSDADRPRLNADLGRAGKIRVRWQVEQASPRPATVRLKETYLWDLTDSAARLLAAIRFDIGPGTVSTLSVGVPNGLEVVGVNARPVDAAAADVNTGWLRSWRVEPPAGPGGRRSLVLDYAGPISRSWQVNVELVPREPFGPAFTLAFPTPAGTRSSPPVFGWRAVGLELTDVPPQVATPVAPEAFLRDDWLLAKFEADPRPPTKAYQRTGAGAAPALRLRAMP
jgi:hypothetical protein